MPALRRRPGRGAGARPTAGGDAGAAPALRPWLVGTRRALEKRTDFHIDFCGYVIKSLQCPFVFCLSMNIHIEALAGKYS